jgi:hypothetical protein
MDIEVQLRKLESRYRVALNGAVAAKAHTMPTETYRLATAHWWVGQAITT